MTDRCISPIELQEGDLVAYLEGDASPRVVQHLQQCPACLAEAQSLNRVGRLLRQGVAGSEQCVTMEQATGTHSKGLVALSRRLSPNPKWRPLLTAVAVCLVAIATVGVFTPAALIPTNPTPTIAVSPLSVGPEPDIAQEAAVPDFTPALLRNEYQPVVVANSGSHLSLPVEHRIIRRKIVDVRLPPRIVTEAPSEIAPPLDLRFELSGL